MPRGKDNEKRQRRKMTAAERAVRAKKKQSAADKRRNAKAAAENASRAAFVDRLRGVSRSSPRFSASSSSAAAADDIPDDADDDDDDDDDDASSRSESNFGDDDGMGVESDRDADGNSTEPPPPPRREHRPADIEAELNDDEQFDGADAPGGVMATYLAAVFSRLHAEVRLWTMYGYRVGLGPYSFGSSMYSKAYRRP